MVDFHGSALALKAWQLLTGVEVNSKFRFNASLDAEAFLLWWPGGLPIEWTPSAGNYTLLVIPRVVCFLL
jgi:hypothetical protein